MSGSAASPTQSADLVSLGDEQQVLAAAAELTRLGGDVITGGAPGLMEASNEGVQRADPDGAGRSVEIRMELHFEPDVNAFVTQTFEDPTL